MVMYMASMAAVPESLYESAGLEGAGRFRQFFQITIPLIWTNIRTTLTFFIISNINLSFLFVKAMTSGKPDGASEVFLSYMYSQAYTCLLYTSGAGTFAQGHLRGTAHRLADVAVFECQRAEFRGNLSVFHVDERGRHRPGWVCVRVHLFL